MLKIYVVQGSTGEYSDHREWLVCAFTREKSAQAFVEVVSARARELQMQYGKYWGIPDGSNEYDPSMEIDYTGVNYHIESVILEN